MDRRQASSNHLDGRTRDTLVANVVDHAATVDDRTVGRDHSCRGQARRSVVVADDRTGRPDSLLDGPRGSHPSAVDAEANGNDRATRSNHAAAVVAAAAGSGSDIHDEADCSRRRHGLHDVRTPPGPRSFLDRGGNVNDNAHADVHPGPGESEQREPDQTRSWFEPEFVKRGIQRNDTTGETPKWDRLHRRRRSRAHP